ncbi:MAG: hypothetical protein BWX80_03827 [Candidatus Hydrogenedentes bacterium ADurb.Bin101]|nr:MAG: hypothetical protein BWX80_03827 [Candidatus Hydrogenedentes bacterium ADurb.Bin101]
MKIVERPDDGFALAGGAFHNLTVNQARSNLDVHRLDVRHDGSKQIEPRFLPAFPAAALLAGSNGTYAGEAIEPPQHIQHIRPARILKPINAELEHVRAGGHSSVHLLA